MKRWAVVLMLAVTACGGGGTTAGTTGSFPTMPETFPTTTLSARGWSLPSLTYMQSLAEATASMESALASADLERIQAAARVQADKARDFRLSLETAGPPPSAVAVEANAMIEASRDLEQTLRSVAQCVGYSACIAAASEARTAMESWAGAVRTFTNAI